MMQIFFLKDWMFKCHIIVMLIYLKCLLVKCHILMQIYKSLLVRCQIIMQESVSKKCHNTMQILSKIFWLSAHIIL